jgi:hypothetical protein
MEGISNSSLHYYLIELDMTHYVMDYETIINCFVAVFQHYKEDITKIFVIHKSRNDIKQLIQHTNKCVDKIRLIVPTAFNNVKQNSLILNNIKDDIVEELKELLDALKKIDIRNPENLDDLENINNMVKKGTLNDYSNTENDLHKKDTN